MDSLGAEEMPDNLKTSYGAERREICPERVLSLRTAFYLQSLATVGTYDILGFGLGVELQCLSAVGTPTFLLVAICQEGEYVALGIFHLLIRGSREPMGKLHYLLLILIPRLHRRNQIRTDSRMQAPASVLPALSSSPFLRVLSSASGAWRPPLFGTGRMLPCEPVPFLLR